MKLLLDECTPKRLRNDFEGHKVQTVNEVGLEGVLNGELLHAAAEHFDVLITVDRRIPFQQNLSQFNLAVVILVAHPCRYAQLKMLIPRALRALETIKPGEVVIVESRGRQR
jgi:predicted nuclease of predicted toxin-antitoxin system